MSVTQGQCPHGKWIVGGYNPCVRCATPVRPDSKRTERLRRVSKALDEHDIHGTEVRGAILVAVIGPLDEPEPYEYEVVMQVVRSVIDELKQKYRPDETNKSQSMGQLGFDYGYEQALFEAESRISLAFSEATLAHHTEETA